MFIEKRYRVNSPFCYLEHLFRQRLSLSPMGLTHSSDYSGTCSQYCSARHRAARYGSGFAVAFPISGYLINRFGSRYTTLGFGLFFTLSLSLLAFAPSFALLTLALALFGVGNGGMDIAMNTSVEVEHRVGVSILNSLHGFFSLGGFIGAGAGSLLASSGVAPEYHFMAVSGVAFGVTLLLGRFLIADAATEAEPVGAAAFALPPRALWGLGAVAFCAAVGEGTMADWSVLYLERSLQTGVGFAALGYASFSLAMLIGRFAGDALVRRFGS